MLYSRYLVLTTLLILGSCCFMTDCLLVLMLGNFCFMTDCLLVLMLGNCCFMTDCLFVLILCNFCFMTDCLLVLILCNCCFIDWVHTCVDAGYSCCFKTNCILVLFLETSLIPGCDRILLCSLVLLHWLNKVAQLSQTGVDAVPCIYNLMLYHVYTT